MSVTPGTPDSLQAVFSLVPALVCLSPFNSCAFALARRRCMLSGRFGWDVWHGWWPTGYCLSINKPGFPLLRASLCFACSIFYRSRCELRAFISRILFHTWWHFFFLPDVSHCDLVKERAVAFQRARDHCGTQQTLSPCLITAGAVHQHLNLVPYLLWVTRALSCCIWWSEPSKDNEKPLAWQYGQTYRILTCLNHSGEWASYMSFTVWLWQPRDAHTKEYCILFPPGEGQYVCKFDDVSILWVPLPSCGGCISTYAVKPLSFSRE